MYVLTAIIVLLIVVRVSVHVFNEGRERVKERQRESAQQAPWLERTQQAQPQPQARQRGMRWQWVLLALLFGVGGFVYWQRNQGGSALGLLQGRPTVELAMQLPLSGTSARSGESASEGIELALETANAAEAGPRFSVTPYDDQGNEEVARTTAQQIVESDAAIVLGPAFSAMAEETGPIYAEADIVSLPTNATSDLITLNETTFQLLFKNSDQGELIAQYIARVLERRGVAVFVANSSYGRTLRQGFEPAAERLRLQATYYEFSNVLELNSFAKEVAKASPTPHPVIVMFATDRDSARILVTLQRLGVEGPFFGVDTIGKPSFLTLLENQPEERNDPGFFSRNLYALAPVILDSASRNILDFAERYQARFGYEPDWPAVAGYDATTLAVAAIRVTEEDPMASRDVLTRRIAIGTFLNRLSSPEDALPGLLGPIWFDQNRSRPQAIRVGRFEHGRFESALVQIARVAVPDPTEERAGTIFPLNSGGYARFQTVVYTGMQLNQLTRLDLDRASFHADFYLWLRFSQRSSDPNRPDPTQIVFPGMISSTFDPERPLIKRTMRDGTEYYLWQIQGEFAAPFDVRRFPFDQQQLELSFLNAEATTEKLVYVIDQTAPSDLPGLEAPNVLNDAVALGVTVPEVLAQMDQWQLTRIRTERIDRVSSALLGDPLRSQSNEVLDRSGFGLIMTLARDPQTAVMPILLPLLVMSLGLWLALLLPPSLSMIQVWLALLGSLAGLVALEAMYQQIGMLGYTLPIINLFYAYFGLLGLAGLTAFVTTFFAQRDSQLAAWRVTYSSRILYTLALGYILIRIALFWWDIGSGLNLLEVLR